MNLGKIARFSEEIRPQTARYAMKREVAAETGRFFRGVCPILNRAIYNETLNIL